MGLCAHKHRKAVHDAWCFTGVEEASFFTDAEAPGWFIRKYDLHRRLMPLMLIQDTFLRRPGSMRADKGLPSFVFTPSRVSCSFHLVRSLRLASIHPSILASVSKCECSNCKLRAL